MASKFEGFFEAIGSICEEYNKEQERKEKEKAEKRKNFEDTSEKKSYTRGTVISVMAESDFDSWDMDRVLEKVDNPEKAEAAVGLIKSGKYDSWDICRILEKL